MIALKFNPNGGEPWVVGPITADEYRGVWQYDLWRYNPWTGNNRTGADIESDPQGLLIVPPDEPLYAASKAVNEILSPHPEKVWSDLMPTPDPLDSITGGQKDSGDTANPKDAAGRAKAPLWLLSPIAKAAWAGAAFIGKVKYGAWNYRGTKVYASVYISAAMRHLDAYLSGETYDPEDGTHHLGNVMACCAILLDCAASGSLIDDRPPSVSLRPAYDEMQALVQPTEAKYAGKIVKHWTIDDTKTP